MVCVRSAWIEATGMTPIMLENGALGYFCSSLDLGFPIPREVIDNKPDRDGADDRTKNMGPRTITAALTAVAGAGARMDQVASSFGVYMVPSVRCNLHYVLDRGANPERVISGMRAVNYDWPIAGPDTVEIALQWIAADPVARDPSSKTAIAWAGASGGSGRVYNLVFNRIYPAGSGGAIAGIIHSNGEVPVRPILDIYGPITNAQVSISTVANSLNTAAQIKVVAGYVIAAGHFLRVNTRDKTVYVDGDTTQPAGSAIDWTNWFWVDLAPQFDNRMTLTGQTTSGSTQVIATWNDGYLT